MFNKVFAISILLFVGYICVIIFQNDTVLGFSSKTTQSKFEKLVYGGLFIFCLFFAISVWFL